MENKKTSLHKGHRQRLKNKVKKFGLECLAPHEVLELLLTYTISRKDTNPIAHNLLERFRNFDGVINASYNDLLKVEGVGSESALFINILSSFVDLYLQNKQQTKSVILNNVQNCVRFFRDNFTIKENEFMVLTCLNKKKKVIRTFVYKGLDETQVAFDIKSLVNNINDKGVASVVLFHTHPNGDVEPSVHDIVSTQKIVHACLMHGIEFDDHIILNESLHYSFKNNNKLKKMVDKYFEIVNVNDLLYVTTKEDKEEN